MEEIAVLRRSLTFVVDQIKSFGREQSGKHKQSAVLRNLRCTKLEFLSRREDLYPASRVASIFSR